MNEIWNEVDLKIPPLITIKVSDVTFGKKNHNTLEKADTKTIEFSF